MLGLGNVPHLRLSGMLLVDSALGSSSYEDPCQEHHRLPHSFLYTLLKDTAYIAYIGSLLASGRNLVCKILHV